ncbi:putative Pol protein, partial [Gregarina niphandrodes]
HQRAYERLKDAVASTIKLHPPKPEGEYVIYTDASETSVGTVLMQRQGEVEVPIEFASKKFSDTRERELFAVKWAIDQWRDYVSLSHFTVVTDHNNLRYLVNVDKGKVFRWALYLKFISGEQNNVADWLSRYSAMTGDCDEFVGQDGPPCGCGEAR